MDARDSQVGDEVRNADGENGEVQSITTEQTQQEMYNLTVDEAHTFFVGDGQWLVHNACRKVNMNAIDWSDYPSHIVPKPKGSLQFLDGAEYNEALRLKNLENSKLRKGDPIAYKGFDIHEIQPVKFGGSPIDITNKLKVPTPLHQKYVTPWWNRLQRMIEKNPAKYLLDF